MTSPSTAVASPWAWNRPEIHIMAAQHDPSTISSASKLIARAVMATILEVVSSPSAVAPRS
jgi:hypothetical protein